MQSISFLGHRWLYEAWRKKGSVLVIVLAIASLAFAHYAGFLMEVPLEIVAIAGAQLAKGVTATFLFYAFFCAVSARVVIAIMQFLLLPLLALGDRLASGFTLKTNWSQKRRFVRSHTKTIRWEGIAWFLIQIPFFLMMMLAIYVKYRDTWLSLFLIFVAILLVSFSILVRAGFFLQPKPKPFIRKAAKRPARKTQATSAILVTVTGALVVLAFLLGFMRANMLRDQVPQMIVTKEFTGRAVVIASSDGALLLFQKQGNAPNSALRYVYSTPEFTISAGSESVFSPIGVRRGQQ